MEPYHSHPYEDVRDGCLTRMLRIALDDGDTAAAEAYATQLYESKQKSSDSLTASWAHDGLLHVLTMHMQAGNHDAAAAFMERHFTTEKPSAALVTALKIINGEDPDYHLHPLYTNGLNALADLHADN
jgi:hypothetical protein